MLYDADCGVHSLYDYGKDADRVVYDVLPYEAMHAMGIPEWKTKGYA